MKACKLSKLQKYNTMYMQKSEICRAKIVIAENKTFLEIHETVILKAYSASVQQVPYEHLMIIEV